ncbi:hypothetical protein MIR68_003451 [Amoeboaphelidium protococcarum]|nr:hypothetical protein MIR68_003451 [Amoeboaphelidium protococcarum]
MIQLQSVKKILKVYIWEWAIVLAFIALGIGLQFIYPFQRYYFLNDQSIQYPHIQETVPPYALFIIGGLVPLVGIVVIGLTYRRTRYDLHHAILGLLLTLLITYLITDIVKLLIGRLRPDFLDRCQPSGTAPNSPCTGDADLVYEGRKSFPSGHASFSFAGLTYLALYISGKIRMLSGRAYLYKFMPFLVLISCAALVAMSRIRDYRHHWQDVVVGSLLGFIVACLIYSFCYYPLWSKMAGMPRLDRDIISGEHMSVSSQHDLETGRNTVQNSNMPLNTLQPNSVKYQDNDGSRTGLNGST